MSLKSLQCEARIFWGEEKANAGFQPAKVVPANLEFAANLSASLASHRVHAKRYTLAGGANQVLDLTSLTNLLDEAVAFVGARWLMVKSNGQPFKVEPDATNGLTWGLSGTTPALVVKANGCVLLLDGDVTTVSGSAKRLKLTNTGGASGDFDVVIGGTA